MSSFLSFECSEFCILHAKIWEILFKNITKNSSRNCTVRRNLLEKTARPVKRNHLQTVEHSNVPLLKIWWSKVTKHHAVRVFWMLRAFFELEMSGWQNLWRKMDWFFRHSENHDFYGTSGRNKRKVILKNLLWIIATVWPTHVRQFLRCYKPAKERM